MKHLTKYTNILHLKIIIYAILFTFLFYKNQQYTLANITNNQVITKKIIPIHKTNKQTNNQNDIKIITILANHTKFDWNNKIAYFLGNVTVIHNNNILHANEIYLYKKPIDKKTTHIILSGIGNIYYNNNIIKLTGEKIQTNFQTKNIDLYLGNFYFKKYKTYGTASHIKQRNNNRYTILQNANLTTCPPEKKYWKITGSKISYNHQDDIFDIWNTCFKIKNIPILYLPYLQLSLKNENNFKYYPLSPECNEHGISIKIPYYFTINRNCYGNISTNFILQKGIQFQNCIQYSKKLNTGRINFEILTNNNLLYNNITSWLLYCNSDNIIQKKWRIHNTFIKNDINYFKNNTLTQINSTKNYYTKKLISFQNMDNTWNINFLYKELQPLNDYIKNIYNTKPQLNFNFYTNKFKPINFHLFGQLTQFKNINHNYPKTIRMHIEPIITTKSKILNSDSNAEIRLKTTHYKQKNIDYYNHTIPITENNILTHSINRYIPQFKTNTKITLQKKIKQHTNQYKQILEPQIQYLYIPYRNQNNIGIYDTTIFPMDYTDLFQNTVFTGIDRIAPTNQLTSALKIKIYNKKDIELLNTSLEQIYFLKQKHIKNYPHNFYNHEKNNNIILATNNEWTINKSLKINTNIQYDTKIQQFKLGHATIEHKTNENKILQMNYRYLNSKYFTKITPEPKHPNYQKNISQIGIIGNFPINDYWTISGTEFYNIKNKQIINQTLGVQFRTCCWKINIGYEKKINFWNTITKFTKYNNKILLNLTLYQSNQQEKPHQEICDILNTSTLPYQTIL